MTTETEVPTAVVPKKSPPTRDEIRAALIGSTPEGEVREINLYGYDMELHTPTLEAVMTTGGDGQTNAERAVDMIIKYCYMPGTKVHIFELADKPQILKWPSGTNLMQLNIAIAEMTGVDMELAEKELLENP